MSRQIFIGSGRPASAASPLLLAESNSVAMLSCSTFLNGGHLFQRGDRFFVPADQVLGRLTCGESIEDTTVSGISISKALQLAEKHGVIRITDLRLADLSALPLSDEEREMVDAWRRGVALAPASPAAAAQGLQLSAEVVAALAAMGLSDLQVLAGMDRQALDRALQALPEGSDEQAVALLAWWNGQQQLETKAEAEKPKAKKGKA